MTNHGHDPCEFNQVNVFGGVIPDRRLDARAAQAVLDMQRALKRDRLRGDENDLIAFHGPRTHVPNVGLLMLRGEVSQDDFTLNNAQVNPKIVPYDPQNRLDAHDMLRGASKWDEPIGTCFMIGNGTILTARHNFIPPDCTDLMEGNIFVVFGHSVLADGSPRRSFTVNKDVFRVKTPQDFHLDVRPESDWVKLQLDDPDGVLASRPMTGTIPLAECRGDIYTLGHPNGLTLRYSRSRTIPDRPTGATFTAFLDGCACSSGSPVFDVATDKLLGVQIRSNMGSGEAEIIGEQRRVSLVCAAGAGIEATLCVASDAIT